MGMDNFGDIARVVHPSAPPPVRPDAAAKGQAPRRLDLPPEKASPPTSDRVDLHATERSPRPQETPTDFQYEVSETQDLVVKVVNARDRSEVIRQYPSEDILKFRSAYRDFLNLMGLAP